MKHLLLALLFPLLCISTSAQTINTFAGKGTVGYSGDGGNARDCELNNPFGITFNGGNLYIADRHNNCVRKIDAAGVITTIAGTGIAGFSGDGGAATAALLNSPVSVVVDISGDIYFSDLGNSRVRKISASGGISTIAGTGTNGYNGDSLQATSAQLSNPRGLALGPTTGSVYIADQGNNRIRRVDNITQMITNYAGSGIAGFDGDGGPATAARLNGPYAIAWGDLGLYIADVDNERIRLVNNVWYMFTIAGTGTLGYSGDFGPATAAKLNEPIGIATDKGGNVYIADGWNGCIRQVNSSGIIRTIAGNGTLGYSGDGGPAVSAQLNDPYGVAVDDGGNIYIADYANNRIRYMTHPTAVPVVNGSSSAISVTPNPNNGTCSVNVTTGSKEPVCLVVTNVTGQKIKQVTGMTNAAIDLQIDVADGIYFLTANTDHEVWHQQIVKVTK